MVLGCIDLHSSYSHYIYELHTTSSLKLISIPIYVLMYVCTVCSSIAYLNQRLYILFFLQEIVSVAYDNVLKYLFLIYTVHRTCLQIQVFSLLVQNVFYRRGHICRMASCAYLYQHTFSPDYLKRQI